MSIALDVILAIIFLASIIMGVQRGFVRMVLGFVAVIVAIVITFSYYQQATQYIRERFLDDFIEKKVVVKVNQLLNVDESVYNMDNSAVNVDGLLEDKSDGLSRFMGLIDTNDLKGLLSSAPSLSEGRQAVVDKMTDTISGFLGSAIAIVLIFCVSMLVLNLIVAAIDRIFSLPVLGTINRIGGLIVGIFCAVAIVLIICALLRFFMPIFEASNFPLISNSTIDNTSAFKHFYSFDPFSIDIDILK